MRPRVSWRSGVEHAIQANSVDLLSYLSRRVGVEDAPDLLGETFATTWRRAGDVPADPEQARMWLFGIARGALQNHRRGERRRWALAERVRANASLCAAPAADEHIEVRDAIARLEPDLAELIQLVHWDGMSIAEAAQIVGIPASTARSRYQRAKEQLRTALSMAAAP